jgi:hypothetical protein
MPLGFKALGNLEKEVVTPLLTVRNSALRPPGYRQQQPSYDFFYLQVY